MKLSDLKVGDEIKWDQIVVLNDIYTSQGPIIKITETAITVQGKKYPEVILINDLKSKRAEILGLKTVEKTEEDVDMRVTRKTPPKEELQKVFEDNGSTINSVAKHYKTGGTQAKKWLIEHRIINANDTCQGKSSKATIEAKQETTESQEPPVTVLVPPNQANKKPSLKVYIAGKITDNPDYKSQFAAAETMLRDKGFIPVSPAVLPPGLEHHEYMTICFSMIDVCDGVYLLGNWKDSIGARMEKAYAFQHTKLLLAGGGY